MSTQTVIKVEGVSKAYQIGQIGTGTVSRDMERFVRTKILRQADPFLKIGETNDRSVKGSSDIVWSLRDINFDIAQGDAVGIIGKNGAGKSTLLKLLSRVTSPTTGSIKVKGRIASLLEVGTGFHPELTGRENIYLNGAILGMRKKEITRKLDEIIDFSGVERYVDTPVKRYSSGMYVRLAFAVAAHLESEILIVDEVLAVGDAEFQKKCLGKMGDISKGQGRTVLFVSHNMAAVRALCGKGILLENGGLSFQGDSNSAISKYMLLGQQSGFGTVIAPGHIDLSKHRNKKRPDVGILSVEIFCNGLKTPYVLTGSHVEFRFAYENPVDYSEPVFGIVIKDHEDLPIVGLNNRNTGDSLKNKGKSGVITVTFPVFRIIKAKSYTVDLYYGDEEDNSDTILDAFGFEVVQSLDGRKPIQEQFNFFYDSDIRIS